VERKWLSLQNRSYEARNSFKELIFKISMH
jgi:hypothetical protein